MLRHARIHSIVLPVADLDASRAWYAACRLGTEVLHDASAGLAVLELCGGTHVALVAAAAGVPASSCSHALLAVPDATEARGQLEALGIPVGPLAIRGRTRVFEFTDPDGHRFEVSDLPPLR